MANELQRAAYAAAVLHRRAGGARRCARVGVCALRGMSSSAPAPSAPAPFPLLTADAGAEWVDNPGVSAQDAVKILVHQIQQSGPISELRRRAVERDPAACTCGTTACLAAHARAYTPPRARLPAARQSPAAAPSRVWLPAYQTQPRRLLPASAAPLPQSSATCSCCTAAARRPMIWTRP